MGRRAKPWYRKGRDAWYAEVGGKQVRLAVGKNGRAEAELQLHRLLAETRTAGPGEPIPTVGALVASFLADCGRRVERDAMSRNTLVFYGRYLRSLAEAAGGLRADELRPHHVAAWLDAHPRWGTTARCQGATSARRLSRWATKRGLVEVDPLAGLEKDRPKRREVVPTADQVKTALDALSPCFRDFLVALKETGARRGDAMEVQAAHFDEDRALWVLPGKTTRRTGRQMVIHLSAAMVEMSKRLARENPTGPLFRNEDGNPWTPSAINSQLIRLRKRTGLGHEITPHGLRHLFATDALESDVPIAVVSELLNHKSTTMVSRTYSHLSERHEHLKAALNRVRPSPSPSPAPATRTPNPAPPASPAPPPDE